MSATVIEEADCVFFFKLQADKASHGEPFQLDGKIEEQERAECITGYRVADKDQDGGDVVDGGTVPNGL